MATQIEKVLKGQLALITGASSGIGAEYARQLAEMGADLIIVARRLDRLEEVAVKLRALNVRVDCVQADLASPGAALSLFNRVTSDREITLLINNAGLGKYGSFLDFPIEDHQSTVQVNTVAPTELSYFFAKHMLAHGKPSYITQVASIAAFQPVGNFTVYSSTKGYMRYFSETLGFELRNTNVKVMCLCPGGTYTEFFLKSGQKITATGHATMMTSEAVVRSAIQAMLKGKSVFVPGFLNKLACFFPRLLPRSLSLHLAFKTMNRAVERVDALAPGASPRFIQSSGQSTATTHPTAQRR